MPKLKSPTFLNRYNTKGNKRKLLALGMVIIVAAGGFAAWSIFGDKFEGNKKVYAQAAGHKVYEQDVRDLIGNTPNISDHDAAQVLADKYLTEALAKEQGISVGTQELEQKYPEVKEQKDNKYAYQNKLNKVYFSKLQAHNNGVYKGKLLITHFSRHVEFKPVLPEDKHNDPKLGDAQSIAQDKKYAEDLINRLYNDINSKKISFDEAIKIEQNDPKVGVKSYPTLPHSSSFDSTYVVNPILNVASIKKQISGLKAGETTKPFVVSVENSLDGKSTAESYFLIVQMDESFAGVGADFEQYVDEAKKRLNYEVNV